MTTAISGMYKRLAFRFALTCCLMLSHPLSSLAQDGATSKETPKQSSDWLHVTDTPPPPGPLKRLDSVFEWTVATVYKVLFYRLGKTDRTYVVYQPQSVFVRESGSDGPYHKLNPTDDYPQNELSPDQVDILAARNKLIPGLVIDGQQRRYRLGTLNQKPVEYIVIKRDEKSDATVSYGDKFVFDPETDNYHKLSRKRDLLTDISVPKETVAKWGQDNSLTISETHSGNQPAYLHTEPVGGVPIVVAWLASGALFFTLYMQFFNCWGLKHSAEIVRGKYDNPAEQGEVTHFQALSSALSGTVGLGNIAGVTIAMTIGGPGAFFWMLISGVLGMSTKFVECTLGVKYRQIDADGTVLGGPMRYLQYGLTSIGLAPLGIFLSITFTIMCIFASFGGGNMLQANQASSAMLHMFQHQDLDQLSELNSKIEAAAGQSDVSTLQTLQTQRSQLKRELSRFEIQFKVIYGVVLAALVGVVIIGGIRRIGAAAERIVPAMCLVYLGACLIIIFRHLDRIPEVVGHVFSEAFTGTAIGGGIVGVIVIGVQRAAFSNEAGAGSAPIAHSAARTDEPIREGCVALLEPFIDTIVVCSMTALVILVTGAWDNDQWILGQGLEGAALTSKAFEHELWWFPYVLSVAVSLFAYSTIISWSYYGERSWAFLFGKRTTFLYKILAVLCVFVGTVVNLGSVLDFSDMMILGMAFPNILGLVLLAPQVKRDLANYWKRYKKGEFPTYL